MSYHHFYKRLEELTARQFPGLANLPPVAWDHMISPFELRLPRSIRENAQNAIRAFYSLSRRESYGQALDPIPGISDVSCRHNSVLMAYDFHSSENGDCRLVEINTNASGFMLATAAELAHGETSASDFPPLQHLHQSFATELKLWGKTQEPPVVAISDEDIEQQKMRLEFIMYKDWFGTLGWRAELVEARDFALQKEVLTAPQMARIDMVYNRLTDFYFSSPLTAPLKKAFQSDAACISPSPREYWLLADKQRLIDFAQPGFLSRAGASQSEIEALEKVLIPSFDKKNFSSEDEIWATRKNLFFKPKRSYGGKSVYRGESVSRKVFERLMQEDIIIQRYQPAQRMPTDDPRSVLNNWKFDLRFFVYADQIQLVTARIYQGQVTNFSSPLGGFTKVEFVPN